jgi:hypothetical protein
MEQCAIARVRVPQLCDMPPPSDDQEKLMFNNSKFDAVVYYYSSQLKEGGKACISRLNVSEL